MSDDDVTFWRYWIADPEYLRSRRAREGRLPMSDAARDKPGWVRGETVAVCRHDRSHVPPHPDCTCGLYAFGAADFAYSLVGSRRVWSEALQGAWFMFHGGVFQAPPIPESPTEQWRFMRENYYAAPNGRRQPLLPPHGGAANRFAFSIYPPVNVRIMGRVELRDAVRGRGIEAPDGTILEPWRAAAATIRELLLEPSGDVAAEEAGCDLAALAAALSDFYAVPCTIGEHPGYGQADWDARTRGDLFDVMHRKLGFSASGQAPPLQRYSTVAVPKHDAPPPEPEPPARFWTATVRGSAAPSGQSGYEVERRQRENQLREERRRFELFEQALLARGVNAHEIRERYRAGRLGRAAASLG